MNTTHLAHCFEFQVQCSVLDVGGWRLDVRGSALSTFASQFHRKNLCCFLTALSFVAIVAISTGHSAEPLINTPLQRGDDEPVAIGNRFNGFSVAQKTVETVANPQPPPFTPLKQGANEITPKPGQALPETSNLKTNPPLHQIAPNVFQIGQVRLDKEKKTVTFPAMLNQKAGPIEYFLVTSSGKTHESVLRTDVPPFQIHIAMLLLGAKGTTNSFPDDPSKSLPGDQVSISVRWKAGRIEKQCRAEELVCNTKAKSGMSKGPWIYNGSAVIDGTFIAQEQGSIIAVMEDPYALINNPRPGREDDKIWMVRSKKVPPPETPVEVVIQLIKAGEKIRQR